MVESHGYSHVGHWSNVIGAVCDCAVEDCQTAHDARLVLACCPDSHVLTFTVDIYRNRVITIVMAQTFLLGIVYQANVYYLPLYLQNAHQLKPLISALLMVPMLAMSSIMSAISGYFISHYRRYAIVIRFGFGMWTL